ncbi:ATP-grasp fold amidoligase family protein [Flavobacterium sandaracinum]|uniref:Glycosyl transferase n=1 Tax=Flavobacterium sandaracinum TaxID=2541733 RepID=A0A4R5CVL3_9FLAO|nr:ATP-grasp fold amidoligase family protein [Flavobacterium sandaracinum]TDE04762.1 glycosyl transferase [Flavobacterium sandaracinum]
MNKIKRIINNPYWILYYFLLATKVSRITPDKWYLKLQYRCFFNKKLNLKNPKSFNEKLQWLKLYDRKPEYIKMVDKHEVKQYVANIIGEEYIIPTLGIWDKFDDIDFDKLPMQFVLKCTHDSGSTIICSDKSKFDFSVAKQKLSNFLKNSHYLPSREWPYKNIKPKIICEKYIEDVSGAELKDYKFMSFNGEVKCLFVCLNRRKITGLNVDFYDMEWLPMPFERHYANSGTLIPRPKFFDKMVEFSEKLSKNIPFVRVDFYETNGKLYFGELTFFPGSGWEEFTPEEWDYKLGSMIKLPMNKVY